MPECLKSTKLFTRITASVVFEMALTVPVQDNDIQHHRTLPMLQVSLAIPPFFCPCNPPTKEWHPSPGSRTTPIKSPSTTRKGCLCKGCLLMHHTAPIGQATCQASNRLRWRLKETWAKNTPASAQSTIPRSPAPQPKYSLKQHSTELNSTPASQ